MSTPEESENSVGCMSETQDIVGLRVRSALIVVALAGGLLGIDFCLGTAAGLYILALAAIWFGLSEFYALSRAGGAAPLPAVGMVSATCLLIAQIACIESGTPLTRILSGTGAVVVLATITGHMFTSETEGYFADVGATILGLLYVWFLGVFFFVGLRHLPNGFAAVLVMVTAVKGGDAIAYGVGRKIGRHKIFPRISPKKSWEGTFAGIAGAVIITVLFNRLLDVWDAAFLEASEALVFGLAVGIAGVLGDLIESNLKRSAGIKDSGYLIAWYGGVLDVIDSVIVSSPVAYFLMVIYGS